MYKPAPIPRAKFLFILLLFLSLITVTAYDINHQNYLAYRMNLETPQKTSFPRFLNLVYPRPGSTGRIAEKICATFDPLVVRELGDQSGQVESNIEATFQLKLDDVIVPRKDATFRQAAILFAFEENGISGSVGGAMSICLRTDLTAGLHKAALQVKSTSGKDHSFTWFFRVDAIQPVLGQRNIMLLLDYFEQSATAE